MFKNMIELSIQNIRAKTLTNVTVKVRNKLKNKASFHKLTRKYVVYLNEIDVHATMY